MPGQTIAVDVRSRLHWIVEVSCTERGTMGSHRVTKDPSVGSLLFRVLDSYLVTESIGLLVGVRDLVVVHFPWDWAGRLVIRLGAK